MHTMQSWQASAVPNQHSEAADRQHSMQLFGVSLSGLWVACVPSFTSSMWGIVFWGVCTVLYVCLLFSQWVQTLCNCSRLFASMLC